MYKICDDCAGKGTESYTDAAGSRSHRDCRNCEGTGKVPSKVKTKIPFKEFQHRCGFHRNETFGGNGCPVDYCYMSFQEKPASIHHKAVAKDVTCMSRCNEEECLRLHFRKDFDRFPK